MTTRAPAEQVNYEYWRDVCHRAKNRSGLRALQLVDNVPPELLLALLDAHEQAALSCEAEG